MTQKCACVFVWASVCENIPVNVPPSSKSRPQPRSLGFLPHLAICSVAPFRRCHSSNGCDLLEYNTNVAHLSGAKYLGKKGQKTELWKMSQPKKNNHGNREMLSKTKKKWNSSDTPHISLCLYFCYIHQTGSSVFFLAKKAQHPTLNHHPSTLQPPPASCHLVDHREATLPHHPTSRPPWRHRFETWLHTPGSDRIGQIFSRSKKLGNCCGQKIKRGKRWGKVRVVFFSHNSFILFFELRHKMPWFVGGFKRVCSNNVLRKKMMRCTYEHWPRNLLCTHLTTHINDMGVSHRYTNIGWSLGPYTQPKKKW